MKGWFEEFEMFEEFEEFEMFEEFLFKPETLQTRNPLH